jgi:hypothetical protein
LRLIEKSFDGLRQCLRGLSYNVQNKLILGVSQSAVYDRLLAVQTTKERDQ